MRDAGAVATGDLMKTSVVTLTAFVGTLLLAQIDRVQAKEPCRCQNGALCAQGCIIPSKSNISNNRVKGPIETKGRGAKRDMSKSIIQNMR